MNKEKLALTLRWKYNMPYCLTRFLYRTDNLNMTNFEYLQYSIFHRWTKKVHNGLFEYYDFDNTQLHREKYVKGNKDAVV